MELRKALEPWRVKIQKVLPSQHAIPDFGGSEVAGAMEEAFEKVMSLQNLICLFGNEATQNPRQSFASHFSGRTHEVIARLPPRSNPFLWQIFAGCFDGRNTYDWLQGEKFPEIKSEAIWHRAKMADFLDSLAAESIDLIHLSNILDWLSPAEAATTLGTAWRSLKRGGKVIIRQLNSSLDIMDDHLSAFKWDHALGAAMERSDRSFFYPGILVGMKE